LLIEGLVKQIHEEIGFEIRDALATHETNTNTRFFELVLTDQHHDERLSTLEAAATSFGDWKPEVESSLTLVRLELLKLNTFLDRDAKATCTPSLEFFRLNQCRVLPKVLPSMAPRAPR
jgi:hypothetical protein